MATAVETESPTRVGVNRLVKYGLLTVLVAIAATALVRAVTLALVGAPADFIPFPLGWGPVIASTALGAVGATVAYGVVTRVSQRPNRTFTIVAAVVLVLSFVPMLTLPPEFADAIAPVMPALLGMHVVVAVVSVGVLTRAPNAGANAEAR
jgi:hypothetical protein